jgi:hypothetical protein
MQKHFIATYNLRMWESLSEMCMPQVKDDET